MVLVVATAVNSFSFHDKSSSAIITTLWEEKKKDAATDLVASLPPTAVDAANAICIMLMVDDADDD